MLAADERSFLERHEFLIRRLHSLSGLIPVGAFMCVHLTVNASVMNGPETFQNLVYQIHSLDKLLPLVEWVFIFLPLIFHAVIGVWIIQSGLPNTNHYGYGANYRYVLQRVTGVIALVFILYHVFHMHGWFHFDWWLALADALGGHEFRPYNAPSTAGEALQNPLIIAFYFVGVVACVFHLANGLWTMGITWGLWTSPQAQKKALALCGVFGAALLMVGLSGLVGMVGIGGDAAKAEAREVEDRMYQHRVADGSVLPNEHKRVHEPSGDTASSHEDESDDAAEDAAEGEN